MHNCMKHDKSSIMVCAVCSGAGRENAYQSLSTETNNRCPFTVGGQAIATGERAVEHAVSVSQRVSASAQIHGNCSCSQ